MSALSEAIANARRIVEEDGREAHEPLAELLDVLDAEPSGLRADLRATAEHAARRARVSGENDTSGEDAYEWAGTAKIALEALASAPADDMPADERAAAAAAVRDLRAQIAELVRQRDGLAVFLDSLANEFEAAQTHTASRVAARVRGALEAVGHDRAGTVAAMEADGVIDRLEEDPDR